LRKKEKSFRKKVKFAEKPFNRKGVRGQEAHKEEKEMETRNLIKNNDHDLLSAGMAEERLFYRHAIPAFVF